MSISYPQQWAQTTYDTTEKPGLNIRFSNEADTLKYFGALNRDFPSGDVVIIVRAYERYWLWFADNELDASLDIFPLRESMEKRSPEMYSDETGLTSTTINNYPAVQTYFRESDDIDGYDLLIDLGNGLIAQIYAYAPTGELQQWNSVVQAIAASISYKPYTKADLTETYTSKDGKVSVNYAKGWETKQRFDMGLLDVGLGEASLDFGIVVGKSESEEVTFESYTNGLAKALQDLPHTIKDSFGSMSLTINLHPAQMMAIPYSDLPQIRVVLVIDLGDGAFANINGSVDKTQFERWQNIAMVIGETITYSP